MSLLEKEKRAIEYLKAFEPEEGSYYLCYSGGKDSDCIRILANLAGVRHECKHNLTTVDAPETVKYVKETIGAENISKPEFTMWQLIVNKKMPPTRIMRYCCEALKARGGKGRVKITGVRKAESVNRKANAGLVSVIGKPKTMRKLADKMDVDADVTPKGGLILNTDNAPSRKFVEMCYRTTSTMVNPIVDWTDEDVWEFLDAYGCKSNPLYQCGHSRIGCIGCPMQNPNKRKAEFARYPKYYKAYIRAFDRMLLARKESGLACDDWRNGVDVMKWWLEDDPRQCSLFEEGV